MARKSDPIDALGPQHWAWIVGVVAGMLAPAALFVLGITVWYGGKTLWLLLEEW